MSNSEPTERAGGVREALVNDLKALVSNYWSIKTADRSNPVFWYEDQARLLERTIAALSPPAAPAEGEPATCYNTGLTCLAGCNGRTCAGANVPLNQWPEQVAAPAEGAVKVKDGWKLVPVEPTDEMRLSCKIGDATMRRRIWDAYLTAAPAPAVDSGAGAEGEAVFLRDLANRLRRVPCEHIDGGDIDQLYEIAARPNPLPADVAAMVKRMRSTPCLKPNPDKNAQSWGEGWISNETEVRSILSEGADFVERLFAHPPAAEARLKTMARALRAARNFLTEQAPNNDPLLDAIDEALLPVNGEG